MSVTRGRSIGLSAAFALFALLLAATPSPAVTIAEFEVEPGSPPGAHVPRYIHPGPNGNLWYTMIGPEGGGLGQIATGGERLPGIEDRDGPVDFAVTADGSLHWVGDSGYGRRLPDGTVQRVSSGAQRYGVLAMPDGQLVFGLLVQSGEFAGTQFCIGDPFGFNECHRDPLAHSRITDFALDATGAVWSAWHEDDTIRRHGFPELVVSLPAGSGPARIALGPEGNLWVTMFKADAVDRITPEAQRTRFQLPPGSGPNDIVLGPDGAFWITEYKASRIARMTTDGQLTHEYPTPTPSSGPTGIDVGPDGALWFTESAGKIGRLVPDSHGPAAGGDASAPSFGPAPAFEPRRFRLGGKAKGKAPRGSRLTFGLSEAASVEVSFSQLVPGRRVGKACRAPSRSNRGKPRCTRALARGKRSFPAAQGANKLRFDGRVGGRKLAPGRYRASLVATDAAGNASAPASAGFAVEP